MSSDRVNGKYTDSSLFYTKICESCNNCELICKSYSVCVHMYSCTCLDFSLHTTVCKRIHMVGMEISRNREKVASQLDYFKGVLASAGCKANKDTTLCKEKCL